LIKAYMAITEKELQERLEKINASLQKDGVPIAQRPLEAMRRYSIEYKTKFLLNSDLADSINKWFESKYGEKLLLSFALYDSVYYFDATFWPIEIPIGYGNFKLDPFSCLKKIPDSVRNDLVSNPNTGWDYAIWWADCLDYAYGLREVSSSTDVTGFGHKLLEAGDQELRATVALLKETRPNPRTMFTSRNAVEIFLKSMLALRGELTEAQAKGFGHNLPKIYQTFIEATGLKHWKNAEKQLDIYPHVEKRYSKQIYENKQLWDGLAFAQSLGALIIRQFTARDTMSAILKMIEHQKANTPSNKKGA